MNSPINYQLPRIFNPLRYDKLVIDDDVFVFNDVERRIERLPYASSSSSCANNSANNSAEDAASDANAMLLSEDSVSATLTRHRVYRNRNSGRGQQQQTRPAWRTKSVECIVGKIPEVRSRCAD